MNLPTVQAPIHKKPLLLYIATNAYAIGALIAQEDTGGVEQPVYYINRTVKMQKLVTQRQKGHYDLRMGVPRAVKSQAIADLLAQFLGEEEFSLGDEVPREVAMAEEVKEQWVMKFDGSSTAQSRGVEVVLYHKEDKTVALLFKLEFSCSNNTAEYEAYLIGLATAFEMGVKHLRVLEHAPRNENRFADALVALGSQIMFKGNNTRVEVSKRDESIIEMLKERFQEEHYEEDWQIPVREALMGEEEAVELKILKDYALVRGELYRRMPGGVLSRCVG
nr:uncharacterized protein LOC111994100 [Quercus suber]